MNLAVKQQERLKQFQHKNKNKVQLAILCNNQTVARLMRLLIMTIEFMVGEDGGINDNLINDKHWYEDNQSISIRNQHNWELEMQQDATATDGKLGLAGNLKLIEKLPPSTWFSNSRPECLIFSDHLSLFNTLEKYWILNKVNLNSSLEHALSYYTISQVPFKCEAEGSRSLDLTWTMIDV